MQSPLIYFHRPLVLHPTLEPRIYPVKQIFIVFYGRQQLKVLFRGLLHINVARKAAVVHLMRWWQLLSQIFLCSYPFPVHSKSIFTAGASWKVIQDKTKFTLLTFVRSEEDDLLDQHPRIFICSTTHYGAFPHAFFSSNALSLKNETLSPTQRLKFLAPTVGIACFPLNEKWWGSFV